MFKRPEDTDIWDDLDDDEKAFMVQCANGLEYRAMITGLEEIRARLTNALTAASREYRE